MSNAGKVLVGFIILASLVWVGVAAGVAQLNRNGNAALAKLANEYETAQKGLAQARADITRIKDETTVFQEGVDAQLGAIRSHLYDVEGRNSLLTELVNRLQYQLETVQTTVKDGQRLRDQRIEEKQDEQKALADAQADVEARKAESAKLTSRLESLREEFKKTFEANVDMVAKVEKKDKG